MGSLGDWKGGGTPSKSKSEFWTGGNIPWVSPKDMKRPIIDSSEDQITADAVEGSSAKRVKAHSILCVTRSGILRHSFPVAVNTVEVTLNQDMKALEPDPGVDPFFVSYYLKGASWDILGTCSKAGTTVNSIETSRLEVYPVPVPPLETQKRIVARIDELFTELDDGEFALARARDDLETYRKSLLKAAVTGELTADWRAANPPEEAGEKLLQRILAERKARWEEDPKNNKKRYKDPAGPAGLAHDLPSSWATISLEQACEANRPIAYGVLQPGPHIDDGVQLVRVGDINHGRIAQNLKQISSPIAEKYPRTRIKGGEVLLTIVGTIGRTAVVPPSLRGANVARAVAVLPVSDGISPDWVHLLLSYVGNQERLVGSAHEVARKTLNLEDVRPFPLPLPPLGEQLRIVEVVSELLLAVEGEIAAETFSSDSIRQSILAAAFRGELVQ